MISQRVVPTLALSGAIALAAASTSVTPTASAATREVREAVSQNWAGYVVNPAGGSDFSSVSGSWVEPTVNCTSSDGDAAFWVGLGGSGQSSALEQVGTEADCTGAGQSTHFSWYELVPAAPVRLPVAIHPGDRVSARVTVDGSSVTISLSDQSTGESATRNLRMSDPDSSSAEWIAEAPSQCDQSLQNCQPVDLADFAKVTFSQASATAGGHTGSIADSAWTPSAVAIGGEDGSSAQPGSSSDGSSFSVTYGADGTAQETSGDGGGGGYYPGSGYGGGAGGDGYGGYGYGYPGGYGYASGYGYSIYSY